MALRPQFSKWKSIKLVKFNKDYPPAPKGAESPARVIYAKGSTHGIHEKVVEQLGLEKFAEVKNYDYERNMQRAAVKAAKAKKAAEELA